MNNSVSVIIPTFNGAGFITRTIQSVLAALVPGDEVLVIDDGSTDDTAAVVQKFGEAVRYIRKENSGQSAARNLGIRLAQCPYITFLDHDDEWLPDKLEIQRNVMEKYPYVVFCFSNMLQRHKKYGIRHDLLSVFRTIPWVGYADSPAHLREILGAGTPYSSIADLPKVRADFNIYVGEMYPADMEVHYIWGQTVMVRKERAGDLLRFPEDMRIMEDWVCFARLAKLGPAAYLDCELAVQVIHGGFRGSEVDDIKQMSTRISLLQRIWGADEQFQKTHSERYQSLLKEKCLTRAKLLISVGRMKEAKEDLKIAGGPLSYRLLASLPYGLVKNILGVRRKVRGLVK
jgi:glycosyltransferase involved in cell wall biosynthesis